MQLLTEPMQSHLAQDVTTLATCWEVRRRDGFELYFTDHDQDIAVAGKIYKSSSGVVPSAVTSQTGLAVDNLEFEGMLDDEAITRHDLLAGLYDHAELRIFMVDYLAPDAGSLHIKNGWLGQVSLRDGQFVVEVRGISSAFQQTIGEVYTPTCRAMLGDTRCKKSLTAYTHTGTVGAVDGRFALVDNTRGEAAGYFSYGTLTITSGANAGISVEITDFRDGRFTLMLPLPYTAEVGDSYQAVAGCDKRIQTCISRFGNAVNFRGEPHLPGNDKILETSATRSTVS